MYIYVYTYLYIHQTPFCIGSCPVFSKFSRGEEPLKVLLKRAMQKDEKMNHRNLEILRNSHGPNQLKIQSTLDGENMIIHAACRILSSNQQKEMTLG